jgi:hypothetical protein
LPSSSVRVRCSKRAASWFRKVNRSAESMVKNASLMLSRVLASRAANRGESVWVWRGAAISWNAPWIRITAPSCERTARPLACRRIRRPLAITASMCSSYGSPSRAHASKLARKVARYSGKQRSIACSTVGAGPGGSSKMDKACADHHTVRAGRSTSHPAKCAIAPADSGSGSCLRMGRGAVDRVIASKQLVRTGGEKTRACFAVEGV